MTLTPGAGNFLLRRCSRRGRAGLRDRRNQRCLNDPRVFNRHMAGALDLCRPGGIHVRIDSKARVAQPGDADRNLVFVPEHIPISVWQRFFRRKNRDMGGNRMLFGTEPPKGDSFQLSVRRDLFRGGHVPTRPQWTSAAEEQTQREQ